MVPDRIMDRCQQVGVVVWTSVVMFVFVAGINIGS